MARKSEKGAIIVPTEISVRSKRDFRAAIYFRYTKNRAQQIDT